MDKKVALITGCSTGIGQEFARQLNSLGWIVYATARRPETLKPLASEGNNTLGLDITNREQIKSVVQEIITSEKQIDLLINNAGYGSMGPSVEITYDELAKQFDTNLFGAIELIKEVVPVMKKIQSGMIVNIGSISGIAPTPFSGPYCASKAAVHAYSDVLRMELAPFGIKVITVQPGGIRTQFGANADKTVNEVLKDDSWYSPISEYVHQRANTSQENATPVETFVKNVLSKLLKKNPPSCIRTGSKSFILPTIKRVLPEKLLDKILMKKYGLTYLSDRGFNKKPN